MEIHDRITRSEFQEHVGRIGGFQRSYCFDEMKFSDPKYLRENYNLIVKKKKRL